MRTSRHGRRASRGRRGSRASRGSRRSRRSRASRMRRHSHSVRRYGSTRAEDDKEIEEYNQELEKQIAQSKYDRMQTKVVMADASDIGYNLNYITEGNLLNHLKNTRGETDYKNLKDIYHYFFKTYISKHTELHVKLTVQKIILVMFLRHADQDIPDVNRLAEFGDKEYKKSILFNVWQPDTKFEGEDEHTLNALQYWEEIGQHIVPQNERHKQEYKRIFKQFLDYRWTVSQRLLPKTSPAPSCQPSLFGWLTGCVARPAVPPAPAALSETSAPS